MTATPTARRRTATGTDDREPELGRRTRRLHHDTDTSGTGETPDTGDAPDAGDTSETGDTDRPRRRARRRRRPEWQTERDAIEAAEDDWLFPFEY